MVPHKTVGEGEPGVSTPPKGENGPDSQALSNKGRLMSQGQGHGNICGVDDLKKGLGVLKWRRCTESGES